MSEQERGVVAERDLVLVVDDHPVVRRGLVALLGAEPWVERVLEADSVANAERMAAEHSVRVAVVDVGLPDGDGVDLTRRLRAAYPRLAVLVLTMTAEPDLARAVLAAGGSGFLVKETDPDILLGALRTVRDGGLVVGPHLPDARQVLAEPATSTPKPFDRLTPRELHLPAGGRRRGERADRASPVRGGQDHSQPVVGDPREGRRIGSCPTRPDGEGRRDTALTRPPPRAPPAPALLASGAWGADGPIASHEGQPPVCPSKRPMWLPSGSSKAANQLVASTPVFSIVTTPPSSTTLASTSSIESTST